MHLNQFRPILAKTLQELSFIVTVSYILASSSPYRKSILKKIIEQFDTFSPDIDESPLAGEDPIKLVERLALEKAHTAKEYYNDGLVIGSDQIALYKGQILGKPHTVENAIKQLTLFSGGTVRFITSLAVCDISNNQNKVTHDITDVSFKELSNTQITHYIDRESPLDCAGSFKAEGLGICLFSKIEAEDPNSLIGLPLIKLVNLLNEFGVDPLLLK